MTPGLGDRELTEELLEQGDRLTAESKALISDIDALLERRHRLPRGTAEPADVDVPEGAATRKR